MNKKIFSLLLFSAFVGNAFAQQFFTITVRNPSKETRNDEPVSVKLKESDMVTRAVVTCDGFEIPSQLDDLDENAYNDELFFLADLEGKKSKTYTVELFNKGIQTAYANKTFAELVVPSKDKSLAKNKQDIYLRGLSFDKKTKDRYHFVHSHGVCFESDLIAMRIYFDDRQTIDLYGKTHKGLVIKDTQFYPSDEQLKANSGDDVLWVGNTYGLGALRGWDGYKQLLFTDMKRQEQRVITEGPLRAIVEVEDRGWVPAPGLRPITANIRYTIYGGHRDFDVDVTFDRDVKDYRFATGLINVKNSVEFSDKQGLRGCWGTDWPVSEKDSAGHKRETVGLGICINPNNIISEQPADKDNYAFVISTKTDELHYGIVFCSDNEDFGYHNAKTWFKFLKSWKEELCNPLEY